LEGTHIARGSDALGAHSSGSEERPAGLPRPARSDRVRPIGRADHEWGRRALASVDLSGVDNR